MRSGACCFFEDPRKTALDANVLWRPEACAFVVTVDAASGDAVAPEDRFDLARLRCGKTVLRMPNGDEHVLLSDSGRAIQLAWRGASIPTDNAYLTYDLSGFRLLDPRLLTLRRLAALQRTRRFPRGLFPPERRAKRLRFVLQALDGQLAGASHRDIASALYGEDHVASDWRGGSDYLRQRVRRYLGTGKDFIESGFRTFLV